MYRVTSDGCSPIKFPLPHLGELQSRPQSTKSRQEAGRLHCTAMSQERHPCCIHATCCPVLGLVQSWWHMVADLPEQPLTDAV